MVIRAATRLSSRPSMSKPVRKKDVLHSLKYFGLEHNLQLHDSHAPADVTPCEAVPQSSAAVSATPATYKPTGHPDELRVRGLGGDGSAEVEALIGDKILDLCLYKRLLKGRSIKDEAALTEVRAIVVSNAVLAAVGQPFVVPKHFEERFWETLSTHEKATCVEATIGRMFLRAEKGKPDGHGIQLEEELVQHVGNIISAAEEREDVIETKNKHLADESSKVTLQKFLSVEARQHANVGMVFFEWLQQRYQLPRPAETVTVQAMPDYRPDMQLPFFGTFQLSIPSNQYSKSPPTVIEISGPPAKSKKLARDAVAMLALIHFGAEPDSKIFRQLENVVPQSQ